MADATIPGAATGSAASGRAAWLVNAALPWILPIGTAACVLAVWEAVVRIWSIPAVNLPAPTAIATNFVKTFGTLAYHAQYTGAEAVGALFIAIAVGTVLAGIMSASPFMRDMLQPNIVAFQLVPKVALAPLFVIWLGIGSESRLFFATFLSFFPIVVSTTAGLQQTDPTAIRLCRSLTATSGQIFFQVRVPFALPYFFNGLKISATMCVIGVVIAEFISAQAGLGFYILLASSRAETTAIFAALVMLCVIGLAIFGAVILAERVARRWYSG
ncbi:ABC transporter permease [Acuticoccus mangrovi]|uniref:ABC transporter permease n=1 Tax=Acuticoccus mangrovi TaxID=2796142 RepID=A0A934MH30_9HYPH|nr:ABC transporter permease [Acuticoccus mangrovi]MBJ3775631.1 ABC transporter permease [Acuticoccus mangrovi]